MCKVKATVAANWHPGTYAPISVFGFFSSFRSFGRSQAKNLQLLCWYLNKIWISDFVLLGNANDSRVGSNPKQPWTISTQYEPTNRVNRYNKIPFKRIRITYNISQHRPVHLDRFNRLKGLNRPKILDLLNRLFRLMRILRLSRTAPVGTRVPE